ncbi:Type IV pilus retractation ATPase PilT [Rhodovastum atsumiense]|uniref:PilT/PilU family type 4a pilus ATPase n=1 Tax=Rhodovastum atsumiense TaxID=504468 RepID=A0A5M6IWT2_9PROT|nr:PilT/PilU family type 4a pilus ATPase [Rhodovastum atsumiense]KAA5612773.1 PilT/PilU family type 4a pilus ATPase [Rhodovastum atsumiense]CAH2602662.1 Type IV pilus retractation ATPase PilT [Rhodovastum atsumiense]
MHDSRLVALLSEMVSLGASDVHVSAGLPTCFRLNGALRSDPAHCWDNDTLRVMVLSILSPRQAGMLEADRQVDLGIGVGAERFRVNVYFARGGLCLALRHLDNRFRSLEALGLPARLRALAALHDGLVLVTGATGSGKSTTLAALLAEVNRTRDCHVITIEDPIEFVHENGRSLIHQRELLADVPDFPSAVRAALREDPDVLLVGEMRDLETIRTALTAAETGHLVFSTLHTNDAVGAIERVVGSFPADEQPLARQRLAMTLRAVIAQRLLPLRDGKGRVAAVEVLMVTSAVANMIDKGRSRQIYGTMQTGMQDGMQTLEQSLAMLVQGRRILPDIAERATPNPAVLAELLRGGIQR